MRINRDGSAQPAGVTPGDVDPGLKSPRQPRGFTPYHVLAITIGGIFIAEIVAMIVISQLSSVSYPVRTLIDAAIMTVLIFPVVYMLTFRRLLVQLDNEREGAAALRRAYGRLRELEAIVDQSPAVAILCRATEGWPVEFASHNVEQFAYSADELVGTGASYLDLVYPEDRERVAAEAARYSAEGVTSFVQQYRIVTNQGAVRWLDVRTWIRRDARGQVTHYQSVVLDITERKEAEEKVQQERHKLKSILDAMRDGVYIVDEAFRIEYVNPVIEEEFGPLSGGKCFEYLHDRAEPCPWCTQPALLDGKTVSREWYSPKTGKTYDLLDTPLRNADGRFSMLKNLRDVTERKQHEQQLEEANRQLRQIALVEQEQRQLAEALVEASLWVSTSLDLNEVLVRLLAAIRSAVPFDSAAILLFDTEQMMALRHSGEAPASRAAVSFEEAELFFEQFPFMRNVREVYEPVLLSADPAQCIGNSPIASAAQCCFMVVPLESGEERSGAIFVARQQTDCFTGADLQRLASLSNHASIAIHNARLFTRMVKARQTADVLREASAALSRSLDLDVVMETSLDYVQRLVPYDGANLILLGQDDELYVRASRGDWPWAMSERLGRSAYEVGDLPDLVELVREQKTVLIADTRHHPRWLPARGTDHALSLLGVPLIAGGKAIGIYVLHKNEAGFFTAEHVALAEAIAAMAAVAVQNAWLFEQVRLGSERLQTLSRRLVEIQESERLFIARELHDEAGQALTSLVVMLRLVEQHAGQPELVRAHVADLDRGLQGVVEGLHRLAMALRPAALDHLGLEAAVRQNAEMVRERYGLVVQVEPFGIETRLPRNVETILYRIVQEALTNVVRHSGASRVDVVLQTRDGKVIVVVEDNGVGFSPSEPMEGEHIGLLGMRERAETLGGSLTIESRPGKGTTIVAEVPYDDPRSGRG
jgi:PAS domain S-box-containing protein